MGESNIQKGQTYAKTTPVESDKDTMIRELDQDEISKYLRIDKGNGKNIVR